LRLNSTSNDVWATFIPETGHAWRWQARTTSQFSIYNETLGVFPFTIESTGAATFSSSVTAGGTITLNAPSANYATLNLNGAAGYGAELKFGEATGGYLAAIRHNYNVGTGLEFYTGGLSSGNLRMYIAPSGNVGIGTASPNHLLQVTSSSNFGAALKVSDVSTQSTGAIALGDGSSSTLGIGMWRAAENSYTTQGNWLNIQGISGIAFMSGTGAFGSNTQRLTIASTGAATFSSSVTATSFFESSDATIKTLVENNYQAKGIESVIAKLYIKNGKQELGYYAQDLEGVLPSAVSKGTDGLLNLSYREVHTAKIAYLEQKIKQLENELGRLS
jgi:hypothetical protein